MKPFYKLNKWTTWFFFRPDLDRFDRGWKLLQFGIFKLTSLPNEGCRITKQNYKGFIIRLYIFTPIEFY